ncbi:FAD-linked oxidoreductase-like protein [Calycina marina]|uniref:Proline dehydrogenase n=1 Tax=Calycina marina TaxID=1763456 RepID=A0A9P7Z3Y2_9HELO|nr:FAD-linked oxidoreductase-like protein [Calycina marina]
MKRLEVRSLRSCVSVRARPVTSPSWTSLQRWHVSISSTTTKSTLQSPQITPPASSRRHVPVCSTTTKSPPQKISFAVPVQQGFPSHQQDIDAEFKKYPPPLSIIPTTTLLRSLLMTYVLSSPHLVNLSLPLLAAIYHKDAFLLNPDRNPVLRFVVRKLFYDHFCAGENEWEVRETIVDVKGMGFHGVILGYAKETIVGQSTTASSESTKIKTTSASEQAILDWKEGTLRTLSMLGRGDFLAVKFTGAGPDVTEALAHNQPPPALMSSSLSEILAQARKQNTRVWIDAEQQIFQPTIDAWTLDLMKSYNTASDAMVYNTYQAYLKFTPEVLARHLRVAQGEGWTLGVKLVRGAYIAVERRDLIHDKIEDTHRAYDGIVDRLVKREFPGVEGFPNVQLMLASHNANSVARGYNTWKIRLEQNLPTIKMEIGQLQGMADEISCGLVQERLLGKGVGPRAFKCLCWGSVQECVNFLMRRVVENRGCLGRTEMWMSGLKGELWRRVKRG